MQQAIHPGNEGLNGAGFLIFELDSQTDSLFHNQPVIIRAVDIQQRPALFIRADAAIPELINAQVPDLNRLLRRRFRGRRRHLRISGRIRFLFRRDVVSRLGFLLCTGLRCIRLS